MSRLSRWSQRKHEASQAEETPEPPTETPPEAAEETPDTPLPDPDDLAPGSEISAFMASGVGEALRRRALRRLFTGEQYGVRDGLDDYDEDYRRLQPLAGELAERLRRWTRPNEEMAMENDSPKAAAEATPDDLASRDSRVADAAEEAPDPPKPLDQG